MWDFLLDNGGTLLLCLVLAAAVALIVRYLYRNHKKGRSSCGCGCAHCPSRGMCHPAPGEKPAHAGTDARTE